MKQRVDNECQEADSQPYALTNPIWVRVGSGPWQAPGVVPFSEMNDPSQDPHIGVLRTHN